LIFYLSRLLQKLFSPWGAVIGLSVIPRCRNYELSALAGYIKHHVFYQYLGIA